MEGSTLDGEDWYVVVNAKASYSVWPVGRALPSGWRTLGPPASRPACLSRIETLWDDLQPGGGGHDH